MSIELVILILGISSISVVKEVIRSRTKAQLGKIQADLKRDLVSRIQDPEMLERIINSKLPLKDLADWVPPAPARERSATPFPKERAERPNSFFLFVGILGFLTGVGLAVGSIFVGYRLQEDLWLAASLVGFVGLAFLTFAIAQPQLRAISSQGRNSQKQS